MSKVRNSRDLGFNPGEKGRPKSENHKSWERRVENFLNSNYTSTEEGRTS